MATFDTKSVISKDTDILKAKVAELKIIRQGTDGTTKKNCSEIQDAKNGRREAKQWEKTDIPSTSNMNIYIDKININVGYVNSTINEWSQCSMTAKTQMLEKTELLLKAKAEYKCIPFNYDEGRLLARMDGYKQHANEQKNEISAISLEISGIGENHERHSIEKKKYAKFFEKMRTKSKVPLVKQQAILSETTIETTIKTNKLNQKHMTNRILAKEHEKRKTKCEQVLQALMQRSASGALNKSMNCME